MKTFLTVILFFAFQAHASLVQVSSVYQDVGNTSRKLKVSGSGLLFTSGGREFVFTASHVSQGESGLAVDLNGVPAKVIGRAMSAGSDLELIEVSGIDPAAIEASYDGSQFNYSPRADQRRRWIDSHNSVPLLAGIKDPNLDADNVFAKTRATILGMDYFSGLIHGDCLIQPGTSGAPLVTVVPDPAAWKASTLPYDVREGLSSLAAGRSVVRGIAIRRERFFTHAAFIPVYQMRSLLDAFLKGKPPTPLVKWRAQGALLYRVDLRDELRETSAFAASTAGGTIVDQGNGVTMEGGDIATLAEDSPKDFLSKVSAFPTFGDAPQMYWLLMMRHPTTSVLINFWCWFDMEFYPTLSRFMMATHEKEGQHMDLVSQLYPRFNKRRDFEITEPQYLKVNKDGVLARIKFADGDQLEFQLNREGILCDKAVCPDHFSPVIEVPSVKGQVYLVDLHQFFFADASRAMTPGLRAPGSGSLSPEAMNKIIYDDLDAEGGKPRMALRKRRADFSQPMKMEQGLETVIEWTR